MIQQQQVLKDLFHQEFSKMVAVIGKILGLDNISVAEDIVSDTFLQATETWAQKGLPPNPTAWLYLVAKQKTWHYFRRQKTFTSKIRPQLKLLHSEATEDTFLDFSLENIRDSQLQMLFALCHPLIASEAQMALALRILCGFGIEEIAEAFFTSKDTINKRLFRAKEKIREEKLTLEMPSTGSLVGRLDSVLHIIYLLFTEGYYSKTRDPVLIKELCLDALRLGLLLRDYEVTNTPKTNALLALICFHASRFPARSTVEDPFVLYDRQDETLWDQSLIEQGWFFLGRSMQGTHLSSYHLEARIASLHVTKGDSLEKWEEILTLYNQLLQINYAPSVALHRTFALYKARGWQVALREAEKLQWQNNHFYHLLMAELHQHSNKKEALHHYQRAYKLAKTEIEQQGILQQISRIEERP